MYSPQVWPELRHREIQIGAEGVEDEPLADPAGPAYRELVLPHTHVLGNLGRGITQIHQDTGYEPAYDIDTAIADYTNWLRAGHDR